MQQKSANSRVPATLCVTRSPAAFSGGGAVHRGSEGDEKESRSALMQEKQERIEIAHLRIRERRKKRKSPSPAPGGGARQLGSSGLVS